MTNLFKENKVLEELEQVAEQNGYTLKKDLRNHLGYCYEYTLYKDDHTVFVGSISNTEQNFRSSQEVIDEMLNGKVDYMAEFEQMYGEN